MFLGLYAIYTIEIDKITFKNIFEDIFKIDIYDIIAYILPIVLDKKVLIIFIGAFNIIPVAYKII